jgi:16S rRNA G966 N2-methylase RsmD
MVEQDRAVLAALERIRTQFGAQQVELVAGDAFGYLGRAKGPFDVVFVDPPFRQNALPAALEQLPAHLSPGARVYVEAPQPMEAAGAWRELRRGRAGQVSYQLLEWRGDDQGSLPRDI